MVNNNSAAAGGWGWFDAGPPQASENAVETENDLSLDLPLATARCFRGADGEKVLAYLRAITLERALGPSAPDTLLRHLEGQRQLVAQLILLVQRGRDGG